MSSAVSDYAEKQAPLYTLHTIVGIRLPITVSVGLQQNKYIATNHTRLNNTWLRIPVNSAEAELMRSSRSVCLSVCL